MTTTDRTPRRPRTAVRWLARVAARDGGAVAVIAALALPVLLGFAGLAIEYGQVLVLRAKAQRTADLAAHAGAVAYGVGGDEEAMRRAGLGVARLNGIAAQEISVVLGATDRSASGNGVRATVTMPKPLYLPAIVGGDASVDVVATALAGLLGGRPACVQALDPSGAGIVLSGGTDLVAAECAVASNAAVEAPCGTSIVAEDLTYDAGDHPMPAHCRTIRAPDGGDTRIARRATADPLAGTAALTAAASHLAAAAGITGPAAPVVPTGPDIEFGWSNGKTESAAQAIGCTASRADKVWTFSCPGLSTVNLGGISLGGGLTLNFNPGAASNVTYTFSGDINLSGAGNTFAGGTYLIAGGIVTGGGSETTFGAGTYHIGEASRKCSGDKYSICNTSRLTFAGPSSFILAAGISNTGGSTLTLGEGSGNSYHIGPAGSGDVLEIGGGSQTYFGDSATRFDLAGGIDGGGGGSCLTLPAADSQRVNGNIIASGAVRFGSGVWAVNGAMHLGGNGGGSSTCRGEMISMNAADATFLLSAAGDAPNNWACRDRAFCVSAGYRDIRLAAPKTGPFADIALIGPLDPGETDGALFHAGASGGQISGAFYMPNGPIDFSGGASASGGEDGCLQLIGAEVTLSGGTSAVSECIAPEGAAGGQVVLLE